MHVKHVSLSSEKLANVHLRGRPVLPNQLQKQIVAILYSYETKILWAETSGDAFQLDMRSHYPAPATPPPTLNSIFNNAYPEPDDGSRRNMLF
jgi:hypothetical protein